MSDFSSQLGPKILGDSPIIVIIEIARIAIFFFVLPKGARNVWRYLLRRNVV
jgi:hypothetical protein